MKRFLCPTLGVSTFGSGASSLGRPRRLAVDPVIRVRQAPGGKFGDNAPHLLGNLEEEKSKKKSSRYREVMSRTIDVPRNLMAGFF